MSVGTRLPASRCPHCSRITDGATDIEGSPSRPVPGDLSICVGCAAVLEYDKDLMPQKIGLIELQAIFTTEPAFATVVRSFQDAVRRVPE